MDVNSAITPAQHQPRSIRAQFRRPAFWVTAVCYVMLTIAVRYFILSPVFRPFVEQNQGGFLSGYFSTRGGYDVVGAVTWAFSSDILIWQQVLAVFVAVLLWRKYKAVAMGILAVIFTVIVLAFCGVLVWALTVRHGY